MECKGAGSETAYFVMQGKVVETGAHAELIARGGKYANLWARQANVDDLAEIVSEASEGIDPEGGINSSALSGVVLEDDAVHSSTAGIKDAAYGSERLERQLEGDDLKQGKS